MREQDFYSNYVASRLRKWGDHCRIENSAGTGTPDINYAIEGNHGWIETKVIHNGKLLFEKFQIPWMKRRIRHMADVWVLAIDDDKFIYLFKALTVAQAPRELYKKWTVVKVEDLEPEVKSKVPWETILQKLTHRID